MYLGSPGMVEMVVGEQPTLEEMGGARIHCTISGCGHYLAESEHDAIGAVRRFLSYLPASWRDAPPAEAAREPKPTDPRRLVPGREGQAFHMPPDGRGPGGEGSPVEIHPPWA